MLADPVALPAASQHHQHGQLPMMIQPSQQQQYHHHAPDHQPPPLAMIAPPPSTRSHVECDDSNGAIATPHKARLCVLRFFPPPLPGCERAFLEQKLQLIEQVRVASVGGYGFKVRCGSFFHVRPGLPESGFYIALVSCYSLYYYKWNEVHKNLGANDSRIFTLGRDDLARPKASINGVVAMFPSVRLEDITAAMINVHAPPPAKKKLGTPPRRKKRRAPSSSSSSSSSSPAAPTKKPKQQQRQKQPGTPLAMSPARTPSTTARRSLLVPAVAASKGRFDGGPLSPCPKANLMLASFAGATSPLETLAEQCVQYLSTPSLASSSHEFALNLNAFLSNPLHRGRPGTFLLNHGFLTMFMHSAHLKELVFDVLQRRFDVRPVTLSTKDVRADTNYRALQEDAATCQLLHDITDFHADIPSMLSFCLYDRPSVLVFMAVHVLGRVRCKRRAESADATFLGSEINVFYEVGWSLPFQPCSPDPPPPFFSQYLWIYPHMIALLQRFLYHAIDQGWLDERYASRWLFARETQEQGIRTHYTKDLPSDFRVVPRPDPHKLTYRQQRMLCTVLLASSSHMLFSL